MDNVPAKYPAKNDDYFNLIPTRNCEDVYSRFFIYLFFKFIGGSLKNH